MRSGEIEISYDAPSTVVYGVFGLKLVLLRLYCVQVYSASVRLRPKAGDRVAGSSSSYGGGRYMTGVSLVSR